MTRPQSCPRVIPSTSWTLCTGSAGVDHGETSLLATAFHADATVDFGPCGRKMGLEFPLLVGREIIVDFLGATAKTQTTTHVITNGRAQVDGDTAVLRALVDATHLRKSEPSRRCRMVNWYEAKLAKKTHVWRMCGLVIDNAWFTGDPQVLLGKPQCSA